MVSINEFLGMYTPKKTIEGYTAALKHFFAFLGVDPEHYFDEYKKARKETIQECDEATDKIMIDVIRWLKNMETIGYKDKDSLCPYCREKLGKR